MIRRSTYMKNSISISSVLPRLLLILFTSSFSIGLNAQTERGIPYQAVLRMDNSAANSTDLLVRYSIYDGQNILYQEEHSTRTSEGGLFNLVIGQGDAIIGSWASIDWQKVLSLSVDINVDGDWDRFGQTDLNAVPVSFYALKAGSVDGMSITELADVTNTVTPEAGYTLKWNGSHWMAGEDAVNDADASPENEIQTLSIDGDLLSLSRQGGSIRLPLQEAIFASGDSGIHYLNGSVGIGTDAPQSLLHLTGSLIAGTDTAIAGSLLRWDHETGAFRAGILEAGFESLWQGANLGHGSFAVNHNTRASGEYSSAFGDGSQANGKNSFAGGLSSLANADGSFSFGYTNYTTGIRSVAFGQSNIASGAFSFITGTGNQTTGRATFAAGEGLQGISMNSAVFGRFNAAFGLTDQWRSADPILEIGNGSNHIDRSNAFLVLKSGRVGIAPGMESPVAQLHIFQQQDTLGGGLRLSAMNTGYWEMVTRADGHLAMYQNGSLKATVDPSTGAWIQLSDFRVKKNIEPLYKGLEQLMKLTPVSYQYTFSESEVTTWGFIAQDVQKLFPNLVRTHGELLGLSYQEFSVLAIKAIQEQQELITEQDLRIRSLESRLEAIEAQLNK